MDTRSVARFVGSEGAQSSIDRYKIIDTDVAVKGRCVTVMVSITRIINGL